MSVAARLGLAAFLLSIIGTATAQTQLASIGDFAPPAGDAAVKLITSIVGGTPTAGPRALLGEAVYVFNLAVLAFAVVIVVYTALVGLLQSAHDGVLLGKKWSAVWIPVRFSICMALLFPTVGGLCLGQVGIIWLMKHGSGIASKAWVAATSKFNETSGIYIAARSADTADIRRTIGQILKAELCSEYLTQYGMASGAAGRTVYYNSETLIGDAARFVGKDYNGGRIEWGGYPGTSVKSDACGAIDIPNTHALNPLLRDHAVADSYGMVQIEGLLRAAQTMHPHAVDCMAPTLDRPGCTYDDYNGALDSGMAAYTSHVASSFYSTAKESNDRLMRSVSRDALERGWATAGSHYFQLMRVLEDLNKATSSTPRVIPMRVAEGGFVGNQIDTLKRSLGYGTGEALSIQDAEMISSIVDGAIDEFFKRTSTTIDALNEVDTTAGGSIDRNYLTGASNALPTLLFGLDSDAANDSSRHFGYDHNNPAPALVQLKTVGDYIRTIGTTGLLISSAMIAGKKIIENTSPQGALAGVFLDRIGLGELPSAMLMLSCVLILIGLALGFLLPYMPFLIWAGAIVGWVVSVVVMLVAAPVWITSHLHPNGDGIASQYSAPGYMIVIELLLRPFLMLFGLIMVITLPDPMLGFFSTEFYSMFASLLADTRPDPWTFVMKILLFAVTCWVLMMLVFNTIATASDNVMKWIGGMTGSYSSMGSDSNSMAKGVIIATAARSVPRMASGGRRGSGSSAVAEESHGNTIRPS